MQKERVMTAAEVLRAECGQPVETAVVLGSGLGPYAETLSEAETIPYERIPYMPRVAVEGHHGTFCVGKKNGRPLIVLPGRVHFHEGFSLEEIVFAVRVLHEIGVRNLILTNSAGAVNLDFHPGDLMLITDHINLSGHNCLVGAGEEFGERFPSMEDVYSAELRSLAEQAAQDAGIPLKKGVYFYYTGPSYETPAEIRAIRLLGADAVGMSTVHEATAAVQLRMRTLGISCLTNMAAGITPQPLSHAEVIETGRRVQHDFQTLLDRILALL